VTVRLMMMPPGLVSITDGDQPLNLTGERIYADRTVSADAEDTSTTHLTGRAWWVATVRHGAHLSWVDKGRR